MSESLPDATHSAATERHATLDAFARALRRESHVLAERPNLLWQQLYNRLQWEQRPVSQQILAAERDRHSNPAAGPWMWLRTALLESPALIRTITGHNAIVTATAFSPDGALIASGCRDDILQLWDARTGRVIASLAGLHPLFLFNGINAFAFNPDGTVLCSARYDGTLKLWNVRTGQVLAPLVGHTAEVSACAFSPDGDTIASVSKNDGTLRLWNARNGQARSVLPADEETAVAYSPDGVILCSGNRFGRLRLIDLHSAEVRILEGHRGKITACIFSPDGATLLSSSEDTTLKIWDVITLHERVTLAGHRGLVTACAYSPDGNIIVSGSTDGTLRLWDAQTGVELATLIGHTNSVNTCAYSPQGGVVVSGGWDRTVKLWDVQVALLQDRSEHRSYSGRLAKAIAFTRDGSTALAAIGWGTINIWDMPSTQERTAITLQREVCELSPDGTAAILRDTSGGDRGTYILWDLWSARELATFASEWLPRPFSADGDIFLSFGRDGTLTSWDTHTGNARPISRFPWQGIPYALSPDGNLVLFIKDEVFALWSLLSGQQETTFVAKLCLLNTVLFSPDGATLLGACYDNTLRLWDTYTGKEHGVFHGHSQLVSACAFTPDGNMVVSCSGDRTLRVWDVHTAKELAILALPGDLTSLAIHPWQPDVLCGDMGGYAYFTRLVKLTFGPLVVTARSGDRAITVQCPICRSKQAINRSQLGAVVACHSIGCNGLMRVNSFMLNTPQ